MPGARRRRGREGSSGIYAAAGDEFGFSLCMLEGSAMHGYYRDPYLLAIARECDAQEAVRGGIEIRPNGPWFTGYASTPRWMQLRSSGLHIQCVQAVFIVRPSYDGDLPVAFDTFQAAHHLTGHGDGYMLDVPGEVIEGSRVDTMDRVQLGASLLAELVAAGL